MEYAELHCLTNFTFLRGASHPGEQVARAAELGYSAIAIADECSVSGVVRALEQATVSGIPLIVGAEFTLDDGLKLVALARDRRGYAHLGALITKGRRRAPKGGYELARGDLVDGLPGCFVLWVPGARPGEDDARWVARAFGGDARIAFERFLEPDDNERLERLRRLGERWELPLVAAGDVHMHVPGRQPLQDLVTAVRLGTTVGEAGHALYPNAERHLRPLERLARLYPDDLLAESANLARACTFRLEELRYEYPEELVPPGATPASHLRDLTEAGLTRRFGTDVPAGIRAQAERELGLVREMGYEPFFLTVHDVVAFARSRGILCQGRGSAANSVICFCLGITEVDPRLVPMVFERFISKERNEPPDIDVDFEHERREEVIQYLYAKYGRERAALAATVICYRPRSAVRDAGKALGLAPAQVERLSRTLQWWDGVEAARERVAEAGLDPRSPVVRRLVELVDRLVGFPRHLSQHTGGFVISRGPLSELVPVENAAMPERTVIQWDKDDLETLGLLKVDVLGLGMLTAIRRCLDLVAVHRHRRYTLATLPKEDPAVYRMIRRADTVGVFQIESRAQMAMLPRLRPEKYYDLVIEVAIVRPGPIQGDMVHPYLARRAGEIEVEYPDDRVRSVLERTLGVPIFQGQAMQLAVVAAGFTPGEADQLRRAMAAWRRRGGMEPFRERLVGGMLERGYSEAFAERLYHQIRGFGEYGFPESHAASFALLVYASAWLKHYEPAAFTAALLNSQPMGFYQPAQLVRDAREHGVEVRPVDVNESDWDCTLEPAPGGALALRLGLRMVAGLGEEPGRRVGERRPASGYREAEELARRAGLDRRVLDALADAGALKPLSANRHRAAWDAAGVEEPSTLFERWAIDEGTPLLGRPTEGQDIVADYRRLGLTLGRHPLALLRDRLARMRLASAGDLRELSDGEFAATAGIVINRQRPESANGVIFMTLEDESAHVNVIVWPDVLERYRRPLLGARLLALDGRVQRQGEVLHLVAERAGDLSFLLGDLVTRSRDFG